MAKISVETNEVHLKDIVNFLILANTHLENLEFFMDNPIILDYIYINDNTSKEDNLSIMKSKQYKVKLQMINFQKEIAILMILNETTHRQILKSLKENNEYKTMLLSTLSHELRTPLNCSLAMLRAAIEYMTEDVLKKKYLIPALNSFFILQSIVDDVLDYWSICCQKFNLNYTKFHLGQFLIDTLTIFQLQAEEKNLGLSLSVDEKVPEEVISDPRRIRQLLINFLVNSFKFTIKGEIGIIVTLENDNLLKFCIHDTGVGIEIEYLEKIKKSIGQTQHIKIGKYAAGIGFGLRFGHMISQYLSVKEMKYFEVNSQLNSGTEISFYVELLKDCDNMERNILPSNGLKNYSKKDKDKDKDKDRDRDSISNYCLGREINSNKKLSIELNSNRYLLKSQVHDEDEESNNFENKFLDENGFFNLTMNLHKAKTMSNRSDHIITENQELHRPVNTIQTMLTSCKCNNILLIDDDMFNLISLKALLSKMGPRQIDFAFNGKLGIEKVENKLRNKCCSTCTGFKMIFMDINMPVMDGFEATKILKQRMKEEKIFDIPIIGCTADTDPEIKRKCLEECRMDDFLTKPVNPNQLRKVVEYFG